MRFEKEKCWSEPSSVADAGEMPASFVEVRGVRMMIWGSKPNNYALFYATWDAERGAWGPGRRVGRPEDANFTRAWGICGATVYQNRLTLVWNRHETSEIYTTTLDNEWNPVERLQDMSISAWTCPAVHGCDGQLVVVFRGYDGALWYTWYENGVWQRSRQVTIFGQTVWASSTPALARSRSGQSGLRLFWSDNHHHRLYTATWVPNGPESGFSRLMELPSDTRAPDGPAAAFLGEVPFVTWNEDGKIFYSYFDPDCRDWRPRREVRTLQESPVVFATTLANLGEELLVSWRSTDEVHYVSSFATRELTFAMVSDVHITAETDLDSQHHGRGFNKQNWQANKKLVEILNQGLPDATHPATKKRVGPLDLVVVAGDLTYSEGVVGRYIDNFWSIYRGVRCPVLAVTGNHDIKSSNSLSNWEVSNKNRDSCKHRGEYPYAAECKGIRFIGLIADQHKQWGNTYLWTYESNFNCLKRQLEETRSEFPVFVTMHYGLDAACNDAWPSDHLSSMLEQLADLSVAGVLSGHSHDPGLWEISKFPRGADGKQRQDKVYDFVAGSVDISNREAPEYDHVIWLFKVTGSKLDARLLKFNWKTGALGWQENIDFIQEDPKRTTHVTSFSCELDWA